nr:hypothetical protein [Tanacetum cinerariifolium]
MTDSEINSKFILRYILIQSVVYFDPRSRLFPTEARVSADQAKTDKDKEDEAYKDVPFVVVVVIVIALIWVEDDLPSDFWTIVLTDTFGKFCI